MKFFIGIGGGLLWLLLGICAWAGEDLKGEDLLDVLKQNRTITREQYESLKKNQQRNKQGKLKKGLQFQSPDGEFEYKIGGRLMFDAAYYDNSGRELGSGTKVRRARMFIAGTLYGNWKFKGEYDFADNDLSVKSAFIAYSGFEEVYIQIGNFKEPFSLEEQTSSKYYTFMEQGLPNVFAPGRNLGIGILTHGNNWTFGAGAFGEGVGDTRTNDEGYGFSSRITYAPVHEKTKAVHVGFSAAFRTPTTDTNTIDFSSTPESDITTVKLVDTGDITLVDNFTTLGVEGAVVLGPLSFQSEYIWSHVNREVSIPDPEFHGFYAYASYFLTGESRVYSAKNGKFGRVRPKKNAGQGGIGAWELAIRYSNLDLNDGGILGGEEDNVTVGINWYVNPRIRFMANYIHIDTDSNAGSENSNVFQMRGQLDF
jgi:phosphate-selective porin OprO/OprP